MNIFDEWVMLNNVICSWRCRFEKVEEKLNKCVTREEAENALKEESYDVRYPLLPESLKYGANEGKWKKSS